MNILLKNVKASLSYLLIALVCTLLGAYMLLNQPKNLRPQSVQEIPTKPVVQQPKQPQAKMDKPIVRERFPLATKGETVETLALLRNYPKLNVLATGYSPGPESTGKTIGHPAYGITYSGVKARRDPASVSTIAADLSIFPLGTILYIPGYGYGIVADKGSAIKGRKIDLYFDSKEQVYKEWGKKRTDVYVIEKGTGKVTEEVMAELDRSAAPVLSEKK
ncbi:3D (Asp-Asp-Asp) domain-containing protein [Aneurinibacillus soli]|uniref:Cell wall-binding protein YocH n=1 Tax=Aneurinibacillus soli TaxID=1500254 RepID=A0A0U4WDK4_9BACL|nr:3D domain-containing protein [Aneurinibacillus soli]PYE57924.1 3D (Asp-Asp-Asp) domain-containing protein [Aneurinibacillus soli]BAU26891.1 Cell wall-binding protein YocH precursor [Aneurinibacillus soli]